ncbi:hypothetical protein HT105_22260, partial [Bacteroides fragilis]|nr:hypothetical protein [Bacteroides fragilis]
MTMGILAMATVVQHLDSLANFVTLGGSQSTWARHVIIASLVSPAASLLGVGLSWLIVGKPIWLIAAFGFLVPALVVSLELCSWKTVYIPVLIAAATAAIFVLRMKDDNGHLGDGNCCATPRFFGQLRHAWRQPKYLGA